jgi:SNF2 family DNA or RNA helicase
VKYPPYSWLRLSEEIRQSPARIWFSLDKLPSKNEHCTVKVCIGGNNASFSDPYDALNNPSMLLPRQKLVLERFLKIAKPLRAKAEFSLDHTNFSSLLPYCTAIPFELAGEGVISMAKMNARIKASLSEDEEQGPVISFSLLKDSMEKISNPRLFGDINTYVIDKNLKAQIIVPAITAGEAELILSSPKLPLVGLCQRDSREMFFTLSRLGIDFSCLDEKALEPDQKKIVLRLILSIDDLSKRMCARAHLVTELKFGDFCDEVEIRATGTIPSFHVAAPWVQDEERFLEHVEIPTLLRRPAQLEQEARSFLFHLGASPARLHDGFDFASEDAFRLIKSISQKDALPSFIELDEHARPSIIEITKKPVVKLKAKEKSPSRIDVALSLSPEFDQSGADFSLLESARENIVVIDEDCLLVADDAHLSTIRYLCEVFGVERPNDYKSKPVIHLALLLNALRDRIEIETSDELVQFLDNFTIAIKEEDYSLPKDLQAKLRPYQHEAVAWLSSLRRSGLGGLLGDEMGLGKTLMVLTHLARLKELGLSHKPVLVVCPTSVIDVWKNEAALHIPSLTTVKWHGPQRYLRADELNDYDIVITSYAILRRDIDTVLKDIEFSTLILDEAQFVRNQDTDSFRAVKSIRCMHRIALTGTPIENHVSDLYSILDCVEEGILGPRSTFEKRFAQPIESGSHQEALGLKMLLAPILTRRRKIEVESELPPKIESVVHCQLSPQQKSLYRQYVAQFTGSFEHGIGKKDNNSHFALLSALTRLRQICCHPSLISGKKDKPESSGKLVALKEILIECLELGRKIIIYSQFLKMQEHIVEMVKTLHPQGALWLHGSTQNRDEVVSSFQKEDGPRVIVVSLKAGGTGITLTQADTVIFADPWWNPAVEDQAIDRAHRIGQKKTVHVIRLIAEDSIECEVVALAQKKRIAAQSVLQEGFKSQGQLTREEVVNLLLREIDRLKPQAREEDEAWDEDEAL